MKLIKPQKLNKGDTIGIISPSSPMASKVPHRVKNGIKMLKKMGFKVMVGKNALKNNDYTAGTQKERIEDMHSMFLNKKVKAIISFIGGFHSNQLLEYLDFELIRKNPKIFMGFSDITVLHWAINKKSGLITFYGPAILTQFGENPSILKYTEEYFRKATMNNSAIGKITPSKEWTDEILNWFTKDDLKRKRKMEKNNGYEWLKKGKAKGKIIGGCITSMLHLKGTKYWPNFKNKILFWEIPESSTDFTKGEPISKIDAHLTDLELAGVFDKINGMIIGRPFGYSQEENKNLKKLIKNKFKNYKFPILYGVDIGHTDPIITVPLGVNALIDSNKNIFQITENGVK